MNQHVMFLKYVATFALIGFFLTTHVAFAQNDPGITSSPVSSAIAGRAYAYSVTVEGTTPITYDLIVKPQGMSINSNGLIGWWPDRNDAGEHPVHLLVTNSIGSDEQQFTVDVMTPPIIDDILDQQANVGEEFSCQVITDAHPDPDYDFVEAPAGMAVTPTGLITWTPSADQVGMHSVQVRAQNIAGRETEQFNVVVTTSTGAVELKSLKTFRLLSVYPQPASTTVSISIESCGFEDLTIELYDLFGRSLNRQKHPIGHGEATTVTCSTEELERGVYMIRVSGKSNALAVPILVR